MARTCNGCATIFDAPIEFSSGNLIEFIEQPDLW